MTVAVPASMDPDHWIEHVSFAPLVIAARKSPLCPPMQACGPLLRCSAKTAGPASTTEASCCGSRGGRRVIAGDKRLITQIRQCKHLPERQMKALCSRVRDILVEESNVHAVSSPVTVCGDIHGQFWDVLEIFRQGGEAPDNSYIFMVRPTFFLPT